MSVNPDAHHVALVLPERIVTQLDALVRHGHFANRQEAVTAAVERLYAEAEMHRLTAQQEAFARLCGAPPLGTSWESLRQAELDRLAWEGGSG